ncbi:MAG: hypothetical protein FJ144_12910 [Deltaproteobacteria bacterium]|nr:hypothetical protein [Deltaproteobacteria bacterium]
MTDDGSINVSMRAYVNLRIGTMAKQSTKGEDTCEPGAPCDFGGTFPYSAAGNILQNRYFLDVEWDHDLLPLVEKWTPDWMTTLEYTLNYRGEYEGIYDYGPSVYKNAFESQQELTAFLKQSPTFAPGQLEFIPSITYFNRHRLRQVATYRNRLFQAFVDMEFGDLFVRFGRQNLVWGETDVFRLLDNINPIDNSFGGFFVDLDERRVPLNMLRGSYFIGGVGGVIDQAFFEGYLAYDNTVAFIPGAPNGSPWANPLGPPTGRTLQILDAPPTSPSSLRGGGRFVFNVSDYTFTAASYVTMLDTQAVHFRGSLPTDPNFHQGVSTITAESTAPRVWINGAAMTTAFPQLKGVLRSEIAWFRNEALFKGPVASAFPRIGGSPLDGNYVANFLGPVLGGTLDTVSRKDTLNFVVGWDMNQYIRALNPAQSFLFSTQFFYRHIFNYDECSFGVPCQSVPIPQPNNSTRVVGLAQDGYLQTLLINTTYNNDIPFTDLTVQTTPGFGMFFDWQGMFVFQPSVRFARDPWRFIIDYSAINSGVYKYQFGLVRDRSNVRLQIEYVL